MLNTGHPDASGLPQAAGVFAVERPEVVELLDLATGRTAHHADVIGADYERALQLRMQLQTDIKREQPRYVCPMCMTPVYLVSRPEGRKFFFRHLLEDGRCSAVTRGLLSQEEINARKYNGVKESWLHLEMKSWIASCLHVDPRFSHVVVEGRWTGAFSGEWRKPDVCATFDGIPVAFEIQLSTTFINVIAQRREFYRQEGGLLFWVFADFNLGARRLTQDDVFYNNNRNAFVVNQRTREDSLRHRRFMLDCIWAEPTLSSCDEDLHREQVAFDSLTLDRVSQRAFHYDFDGKRNRLELDACARRVERRKLVRDKFEAWYIAMVTTKELDTRTWPQLRRAFADEGVALPEKISMLPKVLLNALYSTKHGQVVGWNFSSFIQVAHFVESGHRKYLRYFRRALAAFDRAEQMRVEDQSGRWAAKVAAYRPRIQDGDPAFSLDTTHEALVHFIFPELYPETPG